MIQFHDLFVVMVKRIIAVKYIVHLHTFYCVFNVFFIVLQLDTVRDILTSRVCIIMGHKFLACNS